MQLTDKLNICKVT